MKTVALLLSSLMLAASAHANEPAAAPAKPDLAKGGTIASQVCAACHTADGSRGSPANPILAGQHPEYLAKQLHEFKSGKRKNAIMQGMAAPLSEDDIRNVSAFYASKTAKPGFAKNKDTVALGEKIYRGGIADRNIPACAGCHGPAGSGPLLPAALPPCSRGSARSRYLMSSAAQSGSPCMACRRLASCAKDCGSRAASAGMG